MDFALLFVLIVGLIGVWIIEILAGTPLIAVLITAFVFYNIGKRRGRDGK